MKHQQFMTDQSVSFINIRIMRKILKYSALTMVVSITAINANGQQEYQFANTANNPFLLNPAAGGLSDVIHIEASTRMQWLGYEGGPKTIMLAGNSQFGLGKTKGESIDEFNIKDETMFGSPSVSVAKSKHVVGGKIWNDAIGPFSKTSVQGSYAYHLSLTRSINMGVGLGLGFSSFKINDSKVVLHQADDNGYAQFLGNTSSQGYGDAQVGLVLYSENWFFGASGTQLLKNKIEWNQIMTGSNMNRHAFLIAKYQHEVSKSFSIEPTVVAKFAEKSPVSMDLGARALFNKSTWFGIQYRTNNALVFQIGSNLIKNIYVSYAYEQSIGKIRTSGNMTHEIQIGYYLGKNRNIKKETKSSS